MDELVDFYDALAEEKRILLGVSGNALVAGDKLMLRRAISNLLSNAIRHTPPEGSVDVSISQSAPAAVTLSVENNGETIAAEHLPRLFDRFYRVSSSRDRDSEEAGLGLALARSIARAHGGTLSVSSSDGLTRFDMSNRDRVRTGGSAARVAMREVILS